MITNLRGIINKQRHLLAGTKQMVRRVAREAGEEGVDHVRERAEFRHRTGAVHKGTRNKVVRLAGGAKVVLSNAVKHATFLEHGTKAHEIVARRAKYLVFFWVRMSKMMRVKRVQHPGTKPYRFLQKARDHAYQDAWPQLRRRMRALAAKF